ncbi:MAG: SRPBCC family protein [Polyangia bacterium]
MLLAACVSLPSAAHARPTLDGGHLAALSQYEVLTFSDAYRAGIERGKAIGVIDATPEEVFRVATDFERYKDFMPRIAVSDQLSRTADGAQVVITAELPWPAGRRWIEADYRFERVAKDIFRVRFDMVRGNMRQYLGSLYIEPFSKTQTAITYELVAEPDLTAPKSLINKGVRRTVGKFVHALRQRINDLHQLGMLHPVLPPVPMAKAGVVRPNPATLKARR